MINNYLSPLEFVVSVSRLPNVQFFTQRTEIPSISLNPIEKFTPFKAIYEPGDRINYGELNLSFIVDESMSNYIEVFNWMKGISFPENFNQYQNIKESEEGINSDISVIIKNSHKNPSVRIDYFSCFPISLSPINLDTTTTDVVYPEVTATFQYNYLDITIL